MSYQQLTEGQRYQIALLYEDNFTLTEIGRRLDVNKSTISRELRRNRTPEGYQPNQAQRLSEVRRRTSAKRCVCAKTVDFVEFALSWKWSPEQISGVAELIGLPVSHEWIYRHVYSDKACGGELYKHLRQGKRRYRRGKGKKRSPIPDAVSIELRPAIVDERGRLGPIALDSMFSWILFHPSLPENPKQQSPIPRPYGTRFEKSLPTKGEDIHLSKNREES